MDAFLRAAQEYVARGWPVFPCVHLFKEPLIAGGFKNAFLDLGKVGMTWGPELPPANLAIRTGRESGLVVVDVDPKHGGDASLEAFIRELEEDPLVLNTYTVRTPSGGRHYYYQHPGGSDVSCRVGIRPGLDVRGDGGYVVAPPSVAANGAAYIVENATAPMALPESFQEAFERHRRQPLPVVDTSHGGSLNIIEGGRNDYLARLGGVLRRNGLTQSALSEALHRQNVEVCRPALPANEVGRIVNNMMRYSPNDRALQLLTGALPKELGDDHTASPEDEPLVVRASELMEALFKYLENKDAVFGRPTGVGALDKLLGGGKRNGEVTAWCAEAKTGKNTLWHWQMEKWLTQGISIGYASREISPEKEVLPNLLAVQFQKNVWKEVLTPEARDQYARAIQMWPLFFASGYGTFPFNSLERWVMELRGMGVENFWFDHLHFMLEDPEDHKQAAKFSRDLKKLAQKADCHMDVIIQPNRLAEGQRVGLGALKGGSAIGQNIDTLITLERVEEENVVKVALDAGRGKLTRKGKFYLQYQPETCTFNEVEKAFTQPQKQSGPQRFSRGPIQVVPMKKGVAFPGEIVEEWPCDDDGM